MNRFVLVFNTIPAVPVTRIKRGRSLENDCPKNRNGTMGLVFDSRTLYHTGYSIRKLCPFKIQKHFRSPS